MLLVMKCTVSLNVKNIVLRWTNINDEFEAVHGATNKQ